MMLLIDALVYSVGVVFGLLALAVLIKPNGWRVIAQVAEVLFGVAVGDLTYSPSESDEGDEKEPTAQGAWTLGELMRLKQGLALLALLDESDDCDSGNDEAGSSAVDD